MDLISSYCAETELPEQAANSNQWVHLLPKGWAEGRDGRRFNLADPDAIIREFKTRKVDLPIDYEHQNDLPQARLKGPVPAAGWIKELRADETGLWGRVEWTATAREMIAQKEYRYLSPSMHYNPRTGEIMRLNGAGLVHNPNFHLTALASEQTGAGLAQVAVALGLPAEADVFAILAAIDSLKSPDPERYVPVEAVAELLKDRHQQVALMSEREAEAKVDTALNGGYITPAMVPWATALCRQNPEAFDDFMASSAPTWAHLFRPREFRDLRKDAVRERGDAGAEIAAQLGLPPNALD